MRNVSEWLKVSLVRAPLLLVLAALVCYLSAAKTVYQSLTFDLPAASTAVLQIAETGEGSGPTTKALALVSEVVTAQPTSAIFLGAADAGVGAGIFDTEGHWPQLPYTAADYRSSTRAVSVRSGSAMSAAESSAELLNATSMKPGFTSASLVSVDFVYPLLSTTNLEGELYVHGADSEQIAALQEGLTSLGYQVEVGGVATFGAQLVGAPLVTIMFVMLAMAAVSTNTAGLLTLRRWENLLRTSVLLGATPGQAAMAKLLPLIVGWSISAVAMSLVAIAGLLRIGHNVAWAAPIWAVGLAIDFVVMCTVSLWQMTRLARLAP